MKNPNSHLTAKERDKLSFPVRQLLEQNLLKGKVLDFGCGHGADVEFLQEKGIEIQGYDPHYFNQYPTEKFDTIICIYVLNVLLPTQQSQVIIEISELLKPGGTAYFGVRRDVKYEGYRLHKIHKKQTFQCNVQLTFKSIYKNDFTEIYAFQHFNLIGNSDFPDCPFCQKDKSRDIVAESNKAVAIFDKYPVSKGHTLIIPKKHTANYFDLSFTDQLACWNLVNHVKKRLDGEYQPQGFNVGINVNETAGQTVHHVHIHLIPRYTGDVEEPEGGVRGVIPDRKTYI